MPADASAYDSLSDARATSWIGSPRWDVCWIFSGLWVPPLVLVTFVAATGFASNPLTAPGSLHTQAQFVWLFSALSVLHRLSSIHAVLVSPILRGEVRAHPQRYVYRPLLILAACLLLGEALAFHTRLSFLATPRGKLWAFFVLAYVMLLWERWHFCMQEFGVLSIYRARARQFSPSDRRFDRIYAVVLMLGVNMALYLCLGFRDERELLLYGTPWLRYHGPALAQIADAAFAVGATATAVALVRELRHPQRSLPKLLFYVLIASHTLVLYFFPSALSLFFFSYVLHHWLVAIGLFNRLTFGSYAPASPARRALRYVTTVGPFLAFAVLFEQFFEPLDLAGNLTPLPGVALFSGAPWATKLLAGLVVGGFFAFNYLHYYYDRCLYSFGRPGVRRAVMPLLFG